jgi:hypothetical protein
MGQQPIPYQWMAERYPARRLRLLHYWRRTHQQTLNRYQAYQAVPWLHGSWYEAALCVHHYEGAWNDPNAPYYGGLQMDLSFQAAYGGEYLAAYGTADHWPVVDQLHAAYRAWLSRGWEPWPTTARMCGLL